jgi:hypothetical protein
VETPLKVEAEPGLLGDQIPGERRLPALIQDGLLDSLARSLSFYSLLHKAGSMLGQCRSLNRPGIPGGSDRPGGRAGCATDRLGGLIHEYAQVACHEPAI